MAKFLVPKECHRFMGPMGPTWRSKFVTLQIGWFGEHENSVASNLCADAYPYFCCLDSNFCKILPAWGVRWPQALCDIYCQRARAEQARVGQIMPSRGWGSSTWRWRSTQISGHTYRRYAPTYRGFIMVIAYYSYTHQETKLHPGTGLLKISMD